LQEIKVDNVLYTGQIPINDAAEGMDIGVL